MDFKTYQRRAARTAARQPDPIHRIAILALGLAGETGEIVEPIKKYLGHGHQFDPALLEKELGDLLWYVANLAEEFDLDLNFIAEANIEKLSKRYPAGFTSQASIARVDEVAAA